MIGSSGSLGTQTPDRTVHLSSAARQHIKIRVPKDSQYKYKIVPFIYIFFCNINNYRLQEEILLGTQGFGNNYRVVSGRVMRRVATMSGSRRPRFPPVPI